MCGLALYGAGFVGELVVLGCLSTSVANPLLCLVWELAEEDRGQTHKPCHDILAVSGYFRRLTVGTYLKMPLLRRRTNEANGSRPTSEAIRL